MKKYFFMALAAFTLAACENANNDPNFDLNGELEESYVAITLKADDLGTRAPEGKYEFNDGTPAESAVHSAHVFFFYDDEPYCSEFCRVMPVRATIWMLQKFSSATKRIMRSLM